MKENAPFAQLMDRGRMLRGKIVSKRIIDRWVKINMEVYLCEERASV